MDIGGYAYRPPFVVIRRLAADVIIGCTFSDESLQIRRKVLILADGTIDTQTCCGETYRFSYTRACRHGTVATKDQLGPCCAAHCAATAKRDNGQSCLSKNWPVVLDPRPRLYDKRQMSLTNGFADVQANRPFAIRVANFGASERTLSKNQVLRFANPAPDTVFQVDLPEDAFSRQSAERVCADEISLSHSEESPVSETGGDAKRGASFRNALLELPMHSGVTTRVKEPELPPSVDDLDLSHLDKKLQKRFRKMLSAFTGMWDGNLGVIMDTEHLITLREDAKSFRINPYRTGPAGRTEIRKAVTAMKEDGIIREAKSEWASPVVLIPKSDGSMRFCVDYCRLNELTVRDSYPLPRMEDCLDSLGEAAFFTTLDWNSVFWQIPAAVEDRATTAFNFHEVCFEFCRMTFGLCNAPATFQRTVYMLLSGYRLRTCLVYLDDIIMFSNTAEEHVDHVRFVLTVLKEAGFSLKLKKCKFFAKSVDYLGHAIRPGRLEVATKNTEAVKRFKEPTTQTELRSFLGFCNVYRRFVPNFARTAAPLNAFLRKGCTTELTPFNEEQSAVFELLKKALLSAPIMRLPRADLPYSVDTDACNHRVGCALLQTYPDGTRHPIGFWSRTG